jgi:transcription termination factor Rho
VSDTDTISTEQPAREVAHEAGAPAASSNDAEAAPSGSGPASGTTTRRRGGLTGMVLAELRALAGELNIQDTAGMRKGDLIAAIKERQGAGGSRAQEQLPLTGETAETGGAAAKADAPAQNGASPVADTPPSNERPAASAPAEAPAAAAPTETPVASAATEAPAASAPAEAPAAAASTETPTEAPAASAPAEAPADQASGAQVFTEAAPAPATRRRRGASRPAGAPDSTGDRSSEESPAAEPTRSGHREGREVDGGRSGDTSEPGTPVRNEPAVGAESKSDNEIDTKLATRPDTNGVEARSDNDKPSNRGENRGTATSEQRRESGEQDSAEPRGRRDRRGEENRDNNNRDNGGRDNNGARDNNRDNGARDNNRDAGGNRRQESREDDDEDGGGRRRGRRFRDRNRRGRDRADRRDGGGNAEPEVREDDVLLPVAGILDVLDNYAFVRTSGYLSGPNDVYVSLSMVRRYGLRRGDNVSGAVRQPRDGEQQRQKFNPLVRVDTINGLEPDQAKHRPEFTKLTPLYPNERLRLETESSKLTTRVIDLVMPVGKGQRALIVSPPKAGKTMILQAIANAITTNNPECHLMVVLVDERPEEVTDMQRSVKGEVIASTFDRPPADHTTVAELSIERAKRLVEMGHDVVVLLDSITRLGRAYNLAAPASGRILSGGVDSTALYPPKRFLGAARNIEDGGSLTIFATALVETGSTMDTVIFEEFKGTGNAELKLDRRIADKRIFPAIDVDASGTRKEELLLAPDEMAVTVKLRRVLSALDDQQALDLVLTQLRKTRTNIEFLMQVAKNTPGTED